MLESLGRTLVEDDTNDEKKEKEKKKIQEPAIHKRWCGGGKKA